MKNLKKVPKIVPIDKDTTEKQQAIDNIKAGQNTLIKARAIIKMVNGFESKDIDLCIETLNEMAVEINEMEDEEDTLPSHKTEES